MTRTAAATDLVLPFEIKPLGVRGRIVRLGAAVNDILRQHDYPPPVSALLAEAVALTAMLGASLKFDGKFILQTNTDGPVDMLVADYSSPGKIRGYARFDAGMVANARAPTPAGAARQGPSRHDRRPGRRTWSAIRASCALDGDHARPKRRIGYFAQSEQIPTRLRLAAGPLIGRGAQAARCWRAGAIMVQHLPREGGIEPDADLSRAMRRRAREERRRE